MKNTIRVLLTGLAFIHATTVSAPAQGDSASWEPLKLPGVCSLRIPPNMELQSGLYGALSKAIQRSPSKTVLQQKGLNQFSQAGFGGYARIIIVTEVGEAGDHQPLSGQAPPSPDEVRRVDKLLASLVRADATAMSGGRLLEIQPCRGTKLGDVFAVVCEYRRQINNNPPVHVFRYYVQSNDRVHTVILSYREQDKATWEPVFRQVMQTFQFLGK